MISQYKNVTITSKYFFYITLFILIFPKINLIELPGVRQGIRIDDILIFLLLITNFHKIKIDKLSFIIFIFITLNIFIAFINNNNNPLFFYVPIHYLRFIEYYIFYLLANVYLNKLQIYRIFLLLLIIQFPIGLYEFLTGNPINGALLLGRADALYAGPWEFAVVSTFAFFILNDFAHNHFKKNRKYFKLVINFAIIFITQSRATIIAFFASFPFQSYYNLKIRKFFFIIIVTLFIFILFNPYILEKLSYGYFNFIKTYNFILDYGTSIVSEIYQGNFYFGQRHEELYLEFREYDNAIISRLQHWGRYLSTMNYSHNIYLSLIFGNGSGSGGIINDGWYIKLFIDYGIIGSILFLYMMFKAFLYKPTRPITVFIALSAITLDLFWANKVAYSLSLIIIYYKNR